MKLKLMRSTGIGHTVSEMILGHNIEMCLTTADGLLSERLRNPKFLGPAHSMTGIAPHWQGMSHGMAAYELAPGSGLMGSTAQMIRVPNQQSRHFLHQNKISVRAGEKLELEIWARTWNEPASVRVTLLPLSSMSEPYDITTLEINTSYFRRYTVSLCADRDDNEARLALTFTNPSTIWIDQIHLRPKEEPLLCKKVIDEMATMRIPTLRFPGGIIANAYNWRHGTGPVHLRPAALDPAFHHDWNLNYDFGLDEYLGLCIDQGIRPTLTFNVATGTPQEAAEMAAYCATWFQQKKVEAPLIYWHIANHPYAMTTANMTPAMYAEVIKAYVPGVKAAYPHSRIVAVMGRGDLEAPPEKAPWREALFTEVAELIDLVMVQIYAGASPSSPAEMQLKALADALARVEPSLRAFIEMCRSRTIHWNVGIAEWNWWMQASHWDGRDFEEPPVALRGLFIAGMIRRFAMLAPDLEVAHFYNLVNCMGILNHRNADVEVTEAVAIFKLYRPALPGRFLPLTFDVEAETVEVLALENEEATWIFLTNRNLTETAQVSLNDFKTAQATIVSLSADSPMGAFTCSDLQLDGETITVPPLSLIRVSYTAKT